jgi:hypothetical protein
MFDRQPQLDASARRKQAATITWQVIAAQRGRDDTGFTPKPRRTTMKTIAAVRLLKLALYADAAASMSLAALQLTLPSLLAQHLALPAVLLMETGVFLAAYALLLVAMARAARIPSALVLLIVFGNVGWAGACLVLAASPILAPGALGIAFLLFQAAAVLLFAWLEYAGLSASQSQTRPGGMQLN